MVEHSDELVPGNMAGFGVVVVLERLFYENPFDFNHMVDSRKKFLYLVIHLPSTYLCVLVLLAVHTVDETDIVDEVSLLPVSFYDL